MAVIHSQYPEAGTVKINAQTCIRCGKCVHICPADVLELAEDRVRVLEKTPFGCIGCGHCMMACPNGSIRVTGRNIAPDDLLPMPAREDRAAADALEALMRSRRSIRHFREKTPEKEVLDRVLDMAAAAPMGIPPWDIGCVTVIGRPRVREIAEEVIAGYEKFQ
jgi:Fe-S-cluster-containing hydrogenase component 2